MSGGSRSRGLFDDVDDSKLKHKEIEKKKSVLSVSCFVFMLVFACGSGGQPKPCCHAHPVGVGEW